MNGIILASILLRIAGVGYSLVLLKRSGDRRFGFFTVLLAFMAARQVLTVAGTTGTGLEELPGLVVSGLAILTIHYLDRYVHEEHRIKRELQDTNEELTIFKKAVEHAGHGIFVTDPDGTITYANPAIESVTGYEPDEVVGENPRLWKSGEHDQSFYEEMWATICDGDVWDGEIINENASGEFRWVDTTIAPVTDGGEIEHFVAVDTDVTDRKERQLRIEDQNERLGRLNRMNELLRDVNRRVVTTTKRETLEETVSERFVSDPWVVSTAVVDRTASGRLRTRYVTGDETAIDAILEDTEEAISTLTAAVDHGRTMVSEQVTALSNDDITGDTVGVVPLSYRDRNYGALVVVTESSKLFEIIDHELRTELGDTIGSAINAAERRRELVDDRVTELTFAIEDADAPPFELAAATESDVHLTRTTTDGNGQRIVFLKVDDVDAETAMAAAASISNFSDPTLVSAADGACLLRFVASDTLADTLACHGATLEALHVESDTGDGEIIIDTPVGNDVLPVVEALSSRFDSCELVGRQEREPTIDTAEGFRGELQADLTDRQLEALRTAHLAGYFEWPREHSGEDVAAMMGVCQSTYMQHLRAAERKLTTNLFGDERTSDRRPAVA
ncbi:bacterio-opsin activator domain-containing protein [Haloferax sp. YSSS75]|uniref:bacterio-opsin activator domain-containing protein n=1 Tax=Haloferax sp. YSSS75 TaxID=3388564 RepID=UPI00398D4FA8